MRKVRFLLILVILIVSVTFCNQKSLLFEVSTAPVVDQTTTPVISFDPNGANFVANQDITITATNNPTAIFYRINKNGAWSLWKEYTVPINVTYSCTIVAKGINADGEGVVASAVFSKNGEAPSVSITPNGGSYQSDQSVTVSATNNPTTVEYRINNGAWNAYTEPFTVSSACTVSARATNVNGTGTAGPTSFLIAPYPADDPDPIDFDNGFTEKKASMTITNMGNETYQITGNGTCIYNPTIGKSNYIISGEVKVVNPSPQKYGIFIRMQDSNMEGYCYQYDNNNLRYVFFGPDKNDQSILPDVANVPDYEWHTYIIVVNDNIVKIYLDGVLKFDDNTATNPFFGPPPTWNTGGLGFRFWGPGFTIQVRNFQYQEIQ